MGLTHAPGKVSIVIAPRPKRRETLYVGISIAGTISIIILHHCVIDVYGFMGLASRDERCPAAARTTVSNKLGIGIGIARRIP